MKNLMVIVASVFMSVALVHAGEKQAHRADAHFLDQFMKHHRDGIEMAKMAESKAQSPEIKSMAKKMVKDQTKEIDQMQTWRSRDFASIDKSKDMPPKMDMSRLEKANGTDFDIAFADMMAKHHEDGVAMIDDVKADLRSEQIKTFAERARKNQAHEKDQLAQLKSSIEGTKSGTSSAAP